MEAQAPKEDAVVPARPRAHISVHIFNTLHTYSHQHARQSCTHSTYNAQQYASKACASHLLPLNALRGSLKVISSRYMSSAGAQTRVRRRSPGRSTIGLPEPTQQLNSKCAMYTASRATHSHTLQTKD